MNPASLEDFYNQACQTPSAINEHLPKLKDYAQWCEQVTEFGMGTGLSSIALLMGCKNLISYDINPQWEYIDKILRVLPPGSSWRVCKEDTLTTMSTLPTKLLFIDTWHSYPQLKQELGLHAHKVSKWIILHDTESFKEKGEGWQDWETQGKGELKGLWPAVEEFLASNNPWQIKEHLIHCNGLTILERQGCSQYLSQINRPTK